jgi:hypothetical protein
MIYRDKRGHSVHIQKNKDCLMPTHIQLASQLLRDAATFFRTIGEQNPSLAPQMSENAAVFDEVAILVEKDPHGVLPEHDHEGGCCGGHGHSHSHDHDEEEDEGSCDGKGSCVCGH